MTQFWDPVILSLQTALTAGLLVIVAGILIGGFMARRRFRGKVIVETLLILPLVLPPSVVGFFLIVIFGKNSAVGQMIESLFGHPVIFTWWAAVIASSVVAFPLMYQSAKTGFESVNSEIEDAARIDGAGEWKRFLFITLPLSIKALISGAILSFTRALGEFGATLMFAGNIPGKTQTMPTAIYVALDMGDMKMAWAWVIATVIISFIMLVSTYFFK